MKLIKEAVNDIQYITEADEKTGEKTWYLNGIFMQAEKKNHNGRVYPRDVLMKEVNRYNNEYVSKNRAFGELGHPECFHDKTEILTKNGWKFIKDVIVGESVYTLNNKGEVELQQTTAIYNEPYAGNMVEISGRGINTLVTPNHRFIVEHYPTKEHKFITSQDLLNSANDLQGQYRHCFIPKVQNFTKNNTIETYSLGEFTVNMKAFIEFMAIYLSEGCTVKRKGRKNSYYVHIYQNEGEKANVIRNILNALPWKFRERKRKNSNGIVWTTHDNTLANYLYPLGKAYEKYIPTDILESINMDNASNFLDVYVMGDGRGKRNTKHMKSDVFSTSERLIDDLSHIAFIAGQGTRKYSRVAEKDSKIGDRIIKKENKKPMYFLQLLSTKGIYLDSRFLSVRNVNFTGTVHCVTVPNGTFYARDAGYTFWTGNSPTINLDRVSHMITNLYPDGNNIVGRAKILDTPNGKIVKSLLEGGANLGVSTRGVGSLKPVNGYQLVQDDFRLATAADIVANPSAPDAFVQGIFEDSEWVLTAKGWLPVYQDRAKKLLKEASRDEVEAVALKVWQSFLSKM